MALPGLIKSNFLRFPSWTSFDERSSFAQELLTVTSSNVRRSHSTGRIDETRSSGCVTGVNLTALRWTNNLIALAIFSEIAFRGGGRGEIKPRYIMNIGRKGSSYLLTTDFQDANMDCIPLNLSRGKVGSFLTIQSIVVLTTRDISEPINVSTR